MTGGERLLENGRRSAAVTYGTVQETDSESAYSSDDFSNQPESDQNLLARGKSRKSGRRRFTCRQLVFLGALAAVTVTASLTLCIFPPFFPKISEDKGFGASVYGGIIGTNCLVSFIVTPFLGRHIETLGLRFTLLSGVFTSSVASALCGLLEMYPAGISFVCAAVAIRSFQSVGNAAIIITTFTYASLHFPDNTATIFALNRTAMSVAQMIGPGLGGMLYDLAGYPAPFFVFGLVHLLTMLPLLHVLPGELKLQDGSSVTPTGATTTSNWSVLRLPGIWVAFLTFFVSTMSTGFLSITLESQILRKYELTHIALGLMFGLKDAASSVTSPIWGVLCDRFSYTKVYIVVISLSAAGCFMLFGPSPVLPIHQTLWIVAVGLCVYGVAIGGMHICGVMDALKEAVGHGLPDDATTNSVVAGLWNSLSGGGRFISRCGAGILVDAIGFPYASSIIVLLHVFVAAYAGVYVCTPGDQRGRKPGLTKSKLYSTPSGSRSGDTETSEGGQEGPGTPSQALYVPDRRGRYLSEGPAVYLTSTPQYSYLAASSYNALMAE